MPASSEPTGAPSPLERQTLTVSNGAASSLRRDAGRHLRVPQARAVEVQRQAARARDLGDREDLALREDAAAAAVVRVLDGDERRRREVMVVGADGGGDVGGA